MSVRSLHNPDSVINDEQQSLASQFQMGRNYHEISCMQKKLLHCFNSCYLFFTMSLKTINYKYNVYNIYK